jgi:UDP-N-acetylglucosamine 2-epimerase (non-hydrolysing)
MAVRRHILLVIGTRPEAIKLAPVAWMLARRPDVFTTTVVSTGQHREMLASVLPLLDLHIDRELDVMQANQTLASLTAACMTAFDEVLTEIQPDSVLVQGDTTTAMTCALAAFYRRIPVDHVEAGLRSGSLSEPFPEEANRIVIDALARWLFAPTQQAAEHLLAERLPPERIHVTGNTVVDAVQHIGRRLAASPPPIRDLPDRVLASGAPIALITCHRRESFGGALEEICRALAELAHGHPEIEFVYPVHLNPNIDGPVRRALSGMPNLHLLAPLPYDAFIYLLSRATLAMSDSGGVQEEAPCFGVPVLVLRNRTERLEGVSAGCARLVGTDAGAIVAGVQDVLAEIADNAGARRTSSPYGDGQAGRRIADILAG